MMRGSCFAVVTDVTTLGVAIAAVAALMQWFHGWRSNRCAQSGYLALPLVMKERKPTALPHCCLKPGAEQPRTGARGPWNGEVVQHTLSFPVYSFQASPSYEAGIRMNRSSSGPSYLSILQLHIFHLRDRIERFILPAHSRVLPRSQVPTEDLEVREYKQTPSPRLGMKPDLAIQDSLGILV